MKQILIKHWDKALFIGLLLFFYMDSRNEIAKYDRALENIIEQHQEDKEKLDKILDSLNDSIKVHKDNVDKLGKEYSNLDSELKRIQDERLDKNNSVRSYSDAKLDSILTNYKRPRVRDRN